MIPAIIEKFTHVFQAPIGWDTRRDGPCAALHVRVVNNISAESAWTPTPRELADLNAGGSVILRVYGGQPPVMLYTSPPPVDTEGGLPSEGLCPEVRPVPTPQVRPGSE